MRQTIAILILIFSLLRLDGYCQKIDYSVFNQFFIEIVGEESYHVPFNTIFDLDSTTQKAIWDKYIYSSNRPIDKRKLILVVFDTLSIHKSEIPNIQNLLESTTGIDSLLISKLICDKTLESVIDLKKIKNCGRYALISTNRFTELKKKKYFIEKSNKVIDVGFIRFSNISFDDTGTRGCFYFEKVDTGGHGHPSKIYFIEKNKESWKIKNILKF